ncbi:UPF0182 family protein [Helcobacillus sp. ACRRO]|uniref:UPF0182 family membrane protein n=1 Tax=Helcobacillus TaxID=1161125 RepID=UPI001EF57F77|nr:UPF0182 family protein [Helcobacillus massiliensis]MCG7428016.1 UPF0182 family protein [Helcobacillus sp. ACRRO]MDK7742874.1 UPF0182 family protein [Helcobacillus massiliensis]WOO93589.1 UPF0182 family protein [Helcobacillus massiliensis]
MSFSVPAPGSRPRPKPSGTQEDGKSRFTPLTITLLIIGALLVALVIAAEVVTAYLWYSQLGYVDVVRTRWITQVVLFLLGAALIALPLFFTLRFAYRHRPVHPPITREEQAVEQFRQAVEPLRRLITFAVPGALGIFGGLAAARAWEPVQLAMHAKNFGTTDPIFHNDIGFYVFHLPVIDMALTFLNFIVVATAVAAIAGHFVYGGIAWGQDSGISITKAARRHLGIIAFGYLLILAAQHWVERYHLLNSGHTKFEGASFTDVNALIPSKTILAVAALIVAALMLLWIIKGNWKIPAIGAGLIVLSTLAVGMAYPTLIQNFKVDPNERALEQPYIQHNIDATRAAYKIDKVKETRYQAKTDADAGALRSDASTTAQIRLMDPGVVSPTFEQREANRPYWGFEDQLSVDRYDIDGKQQDTVIGVRELRPDKLNLANRDWVTQHVVYTHGYGVAAAYGNRRQPNGEPSFFQSGVPGSGPFGDYQERVYFGRHSPDYSVVGAPKGSDPQEFDYQSGGTDGKGDGSQVSNTYTGDGGPKIGNRFVRLLYAVKFREPNIFISSYVNSESQILYDRNPRDRVKKVAPYLSLDSEMYPAVVDGKLKWVIDAYTTTDRYPYAQSMDFNTVVTDAKTNGQATADQRQADVNYIRNSAKVTVDAFDGSVEIYTWDTEDPILRAWNDVFPTSHRAATKISSDLMSHLRYPSDLFKSQRHMLGQYHVTDADEFFGGQDFWQVTPDPNRAAAGQNSKDGQSMVVQPPLYLSMKMPNQDGPRFSVSTSYIPVAGQDVLMGFLAVDSETGSTAGNPADSYGDMNLLVLPTANPVSAPRQVQNTFNTNPEVSRELNLLRTGNSEVINGNLLTLPMGGGLLYVQPVYVMSSSSGGGTSYPLLRKVLVSFGDKVGYADTLDEALDAVFGGDSGANAGDAEVPTKGEAGAVEGANPAPGTDGQQPKDGATPQPSPSPTPSADPSSPAAPAPADADALTKALDDLDAAQKEADKALKDGDWAAYGEAQKKMDDAIKRAREANGKQ